MKAKLAPARTLAASGALAIAALACAAAVDPAAAQYYGSPYGRSSPYGAPYARDQYGRPVDQYGRPIRQAPQGGREAKRDPAGPSNGSAPLLAIVSLNDQRVTVYDANGRKMLQSPVSTGATNYETPVGIYSVVQKKEQHQSNQYEDGNMPFMQRITWTGIALHAGVLPGQPASHGCVRLPIAFAERLFGLTDIGLRVIVVRDDILPGEISHAALFKPSVTRREAALTAPAAGGGKAPPVRVNAPSAERAPAPPPGSPRFLEFLKSRAAAKSAEAEAASKKAAAAKQAAARKAAEAAPAVKLVRASEANQARAHEVLQKAEQTLAAATASSTASAPQAEAQTDAEREKADAEKARAAAKLTDAQTAKERAVAKLAEATAQLEVAKAQAQAKAEAAELADKEFKAAEVAREAAAGAAEEASRQMSPVSVFISRKTQRLYIRKGYQPLHESPVTIRDADKPIGSYVFTALNYAGEGTDVRWSLVSMYKASGKDEPPAQGKRRPSDNRGSDAAQADVAGAKAALDRIVIPKDTLERISEVVLPGSSLIISDEGASIETGKDTDFVVLISGEPQGGIKTRRREQPRYRDGDDFWGGGGGRRGGGGCMFLFGC